MAGIGSLAVQVTAFSAGLSKGLDTAQGKLGGFASGIAGLFGGITAQLDVGAAISAFVGMVRNEMEAIDATAKLSDTLGISTEALVALQHAADLAGVSQEGLNKGLIQIGKLAGEAAAGEQQALEKLAKFGIVADDFIGAGLDQQFIQIASAIQALPEEQRIAASMELLKKGGAALGPLLREAGGDMDVLIANAEKLGLTFSRTDAGKVEEANDAITRLQSSFTGIVRSAAIEFAPIVEGLANGFREMVAQGGGLRGIFHDLAQHAATMAGVVIEMLIAVQKSIDKAGGLEKAAKDSFVMPGDVVGAVKKVGSFIGDAMADEAGATMSESVKALMKIKETINEKVAGIGGEMISGGAFGAAHEADLLREKQKAALARGAEGLAKYMEEQDKLVATFGMTKDQLELYNLAQLKLAPAQMDAAKALQAQRTALEEQAAGLEKGKKLVEDMIQPYEAFNNRLIEIDQALLGLGGQGGAIGDMAIGRAFEQLEAGIGKAAEISFPKALEEGSAEALSAIARFERGDAVETAQQRVERVLKQQLEKQAMELEQAKAIRKALEKANVIKKAEF